MRDEPALAASTGDLLIGGMVAEGIIRIRDVHLHDGSLWLLTGHADGEVLRLRPRQR